MASIVEQRRKTKNEGDSGISFRLSSFVVGLSSATDWRTLGWLAGFALLQGLLLLVLMPPWQHYDEPTHFEYAALIARYHGVPGPQMQDIELKRTIADSAYRYRLWGAGHQPDLFSAAGPFIGYSQAVHPPLYYALLALPLRLVSGFPIEWQLLVARFCSVLFYTLTILAAWRFAATLVPDEPLAQMCIPLLMLCVPGYSDLMSAVNNDVLVNFAATSMLLGCVLLLRDGIRWPWLLLASLALICALLTKRTAVVLVVPYLLSIVWAVYREQVARRAWWAGLLVLLVLGAIAVRLEARNGSFVLLPHGWLQALDTSYLRLNIAAWLLSFSDWQRALPLYGSAAEVLFTSFWLRLGWSHIQVPLFWGWCIGGLLVLAGIGLLLRLFFRPLELALWEQRALWMLGVALLVATLSAMLRMHPLPATYTPSFLTGGRYTFFVLLPLLWLLALGLQALVPQRWQPHSLPVLVGIFMLFTLNIWFWTVPAFYYWPNPL
jgi:hypothetical protein